MGALCGVVAVAQDRTKPWYAMDYGPVVSLTIEGFDAANVAYKARAIDLGEGAFVVFDTELLRVASMWTDGYLELRGTPFDGAHGPIPRPRGTRILETAVEPGVAFDGSFADPRAIPFGPLPDAHAAYRGFYLHGDDAVIEYEVGGGARIREGFARVESPHSAPDAVRGIVRQIAIEGLGADGVSLAIAHVDGTAQVLEDGSVELSVLEPDIARVTLDRVDSWAALAMGGPARGDYADPSRGKGVVLKWVDAFGARMKNGAELNALIDGEAASNDDEPARSVFSDAERARFVMDLGAVVDVTRVHSFAWHTSTRSRQSYTLFGHSGAAPDLAAEDPATAGWSEIAVVDSLPLGLGGKHGVAIGELDGKPLGEFRHLMFDVRRASGGTFFTEIDVFADDVPAPTFAQRRDVTRLGFASRPAGASLAIDDRRVVLRVPGKPTSQRIGLVCAPVAAAEAFAALCRAAGPVPDLAAKTAGGPRRWPHEIVTSGRIGDGDAGFVVDTITVPDKNPWNAWLRFGAFDFVDANAAVLSTWNGDVWRVDGLDSDLDVLTWRRIATGLHDPLGLLVVDGVIHVHGRDGITKLHDRNGDLEIDYFECFNNDILVTRNFHEFAFDLQTDADGNFYFSKGGPVKPGGRGFDQILPHHGTIQKLSRDGQKLETYATGLRAPNGLGVSPRGVITSGDNEGTWMPACRLNWLPRAGMFTSCVDTSHQEPRPTAYGEPLCWFPMDVDNSGGGQVWVPEGAFGPLAGRLLHQSYGTCNLYLVAVQEHADGRAQGGVMRLPLSFASSQMRARFHQGQGGDGQLYVCGFKGWQTRAAKDTAFERVRYTGKPLRMLTDWRVTGPDTLRLTFAESLDAELAVDPGSYTLEIWNYKWSQDYGSAEYRPSDPNAVVKSGERNRDRLQVRRAELVGDGAREVVLHVDGLQACMQFRLAYDLESAGDGAAVLGETFGTIHFFGDS